MADNRWIIPFFGAFLAIVAICTPVFTLPIIPLGRITVWMWGSFIDDTGIGLFELSGDMVFGGIIVMIIAIVGMLLTFFGSFKLKKREVEGKTLKLMFLIGGLLIAGSGVLYIVQVITTDSLATIIPFIVYNFAIYGLMVAGVIVIISIVLTF